MQAWHKVVQRSGAERSVTKWWRLAALLSLGFLVFAGLAGWLLAPTGSAQANWQKRLPASVTVQFANEAMPTGGDGLAASSGSHDPSGVIVEYASNAAPATIDNAAKEAGGAVVRRLAAPRNGSSGFALVRSESATPQDLAKKLQGAPGVLAVSLNYARSISGPPNDSLFDRLWGLENTGQTGGTPGADISALDAWDTTTGSSSVVVVDLDTGIDYTHPDLAANVWRNPAEIAGDGIDNDGNGYVDDVYGIDEWAHDSDPMDENGHGTHTAGTIAAVGDNGMGVIGVSWNAKVMGLRFLSEWGMGFDFDAITCIEYAIDMKLHHGVNIVAINASWGGGGYSQALKDAITAAGDADIVFCAAAGNEGNDNDSQPAYPASFDCPNIIAVAATDCDDDLAWFSNFGASTVDIGAPGVDIMSTIPGAVNYVPGEGGDFFFDDAEGSGAGWTASAGTWGRTTDRAYSGAYSWTDSPGGKYKNNANASLVSPVIDLSSAPVGTRLGFQLNFDLADNDWLALDLSDDGGSTWYEWGIMGGYTGGEWFPMLEELPSYFLTSQFRMRFRLSTDASGTADGVYLDDVGIGVGKPGYAAWDGTSMATPHVSGTVALLASTAPAEPATVRVTRVLAAADATPSLAGKCTSGGRLDAALALATHLYEQTAGTLTWTGQWSQGTDPGCSGGNYRYATQPGAAVGASFNRTGAYYIAKTGPDQGFARITLDGKVVGKVSLFSATTKYRQVVWKKTGLAPGDHTLRIDYLGGVAMRAAINVDCFLVAGKLIGDAPTITRLSPSSGSYLGGTSVTITGTGFYDVAGVTFDGVAAESFTVVSPTQIVAVAPAHVLGYAQVAVTTGWGITPDTKAGVFSYDSGPRRYEETEPYLTYEGPWTSMGNGFCSGGSLRYVNSTGASVTVRFDGRSVGYVATIAPNQGVATITLDGVPQGNVSLYSPVTRCKQVVWSKSWSSAAKHTLRIEWSGVPGAGKATTINLDALDITGNLLPLAP